MYHTILNPEPFVFIPECYIKEDGTLLDEPWTMMWIQNRVFQVDYSNENAKQDSGAELERVSRQALWIAILVVFDVRKPVNEFGCEIDIIPWSV
jgi:hypothetical protein